MTDPRREQVEGDRASLELRTPTNDPGVWRSPRRQIAIVLGAAALMLLPGLDAIDLWAPDEPRYGQIAEELRSFEHGTKGLVLLHLNGEAYTQKPPLYYWCAAAVGAPFGHVGELAVRLPSVLGAMGVMLIALAIGRRTHPGRLVGLIGALLLLTVLRFAHQARRAQLDVLLTLFEWLGLYCYWRIYERIESGASDPVGDRRDLIGLHGALSLALLTKGPVGLLVYAVIIVHLIAVGRGREIRRVFPSWGPALALAPVTIWILAAATLAGEGFLFEAVWENVVSRFFTGTAHVRPIYYYVYQLPIDFLPWTLLWPLAVYALLSDEEAPKARTGQKLLAVIPLVYFVFFSISSGKRGLYLLPAFPAIALLCAAGLERARHHASERRAVAIVGGSICALIAGVGGVIALLSGIGPDALVDLPQVVSARSRLEGWQAPDALGPALVTLGVAGLVLHRRFGPYRPLHRFALARCGAVGALKRGIPRRNPPQPPLKSPRPIAEAAARRSAPDERIAVFDQHALAGGIAYYSGREVIALDTPDEVDDFLEGGGSLVITKHSRLGKLDPLRDRLVRQGKADALTILSRSRNGRRQLVLLGPGARLEPGDDRSRNAGPRASTHSVDHTVQIRHLPPGSDHEEHACVGPRGSGVPSPARFSEGHPTPHLLAHWNQVGISP